MTLVKVSKHTTRVVRRVDGGFVVFDVPGNAKAAFFPEKGDALLYAKRPDWTKDSDIDD